MAQQPVVSGPIISHKAKASLSSNQPKTADRLVEATSSSAREVGLAPNPVAGIASEVGLQHPASAHRSHLVWLPLWGRLMAISGGIVMLGIGGGTRQQANPLIDSPLEVKPAPLSVQTATAQLKTVQAWSSGNGTVQANQFRNLNFDVPGKVTFITKGPHGQQLRPGDAVVAGQLLATVDDRRLQADLVQAQSGVVEAQEQFAAQQAQVAAAQAQVAQAQSQVTEAQAQVSRSHSALSLRAKEMQRYNALAAQGVISTSDLDGQRNGRDEAQAQLWASEARVSAAQGEVTAAQAQLRVAQQQLRAAEARIATAKAKVDQVEVSLEETRLYAPFDGVVGHMNLRLGEHYYSSGGTAQLAQDDAAVAASVPIVLFDPSHLVVEVSLPVEGEQQPQVGQPAYILSQPSAADQLVNLAGASSALEQLSQVRGRVVSVSPAVDPSLRARQVTVAVEQGAERLQYGDFVTAKVVVATVENAVTIPLDAISFRDRQPYAFVLEPGEQDGTTKVAQRRLKLGLVDTADQQVLQGVSLGEEVVVEGQNRLVDQASVHPVQVWSSGQAETGPF